ncbi:hypothetical protein SAMN05421848_0432 [Kushneria avicenniae]|uniref:SnoaL-like domain-containing protein n=1 Tax=Kushneria avicenniae TaxID=402385 RepID=A0A1I1G704_9GAMM|nr:hypothetical protein [Kushneria avicenniae]SFC07102.1 hypothetical protein SAMN05421848_0432 [Kushneria avicenniae]
MEERALNLMREHAIRDIAHRWFAFFEGETEPVEQHLALFTPEVRLVHAGTHLLAAGRDRLGQWLQQVPNEQDAHFIHALKWQMLDADSAEVAMEIDYRVAQSDGSLGGAIIEYRAEVVFDADGNAVFRCLQKTPVAPNPAREYRDSFADNRLRAAVARLGFLAACGTTDRIGQELLGRNAMSDWTKLTPTLPLALLAEARITRFDGDALTLELSADEMQPLRLSFAERTGRYPSLWRIEWI